MAMTHCKECGAEISKSAKTCPNCGKKQKGPVLGIVIGLIVVAVIIGAIAGGSGSGDKLGGTATEKFTVESSTMTFDGFSNYIEGTIKNNTDKEYSYVQVTFNLYDASGNQIGTAVDNINNLQPNATWKYKAIGLTSEQAARFEFAEFTSW